MKNITKYIFTISIVFNAIFLFYTGHKIIRICSKAAIPPNWLNKARKDHFEKLPLDTNSIVFLGASIVQYCEWHELLKNHNVANRGISNDKVQDVLDRADNIIKHNPCKVFIMVGLNDILSKRTVSQTAGDYKRLVEKIQCESPHTIIYITSLLPVNRSASYEDINRKIAILNEYYRKIAHTNNCVFVDLFNEFRDRKGRLREELTEDGIHLNGEGYKIWAQKIAPYIKE